ncbi:MAG: hypothetical protein AAB504_02845, partial [Patescibacteria group bacterium]
MSKSREKSFGWGEEAGEAIKKKLGFKKEIEEPKPQSLGAAAAEEETKKPHDFGVYGTYGEPEEKAEELEKKPFTQEDSEKLVKIAMGTNVFEKPDKELEKPKPHHGNVIDEQIESMTLRLKNLKNQSEIFDKKATSEQKQERQKLIETLKHGIEEAKLRKEEIGKKIKDKKPERTEIKLKQPEIKPQTGQFKKFKKEKDYIHTEIDRLGENIGLAKAEFRKAKTPEEKKKAEEKVQFFIAELEKAKNIRDKIQDSFKIGGKKETKIRSQVEADIAENQPKTYGGKILTEESIPEDLKEFINKEKEIKREQETQKENMPDLTTPKEESAIALERFRELLERFRELRVKIEIMLSQF